MYCLRFKGNAKINRKFDARADKRIPLGFCKGIADQFLRVPNNAINTCQAVIFINYDSRHVKRLLDENGEIELEIYLGSFSTNKVVADCVKHHVNKTGSLCDQSDSGTQIEEILPSGDLQTEELVEKVIPSGMEQQSKYPHRSRRPPEQRYEALAAQTAPAELFLLEKVREW